MKRVCIIGSKGVMSKQTSETTIKRVSNSFSQSVIVVVRTRMDEQSGKAETWFLILASLLILALGSREGS